MRRRFLDTGFLRKMFGQDVSVITRPSYGATDVGRGRKNNEDSYLILPESEIYMVADGMGGYNAGEVASTNAVKIIGEYLGPKRISEMRKDKEKIEKEMRNAVMEAHRRIQEMSARRTEYIGMGSTIVIAFIHNNELYTCHVGDSRAYVINSSGITQVTNDHSVVGELVQAGKMTKEEARLSPMKNRITQALGAQFSINPEYNRHKLSGGDIILLCSDGLWDMLSDKEIHATVMAGGTLEDTCNRLIQQANEAGGEDNITVVLVQITESEEHQRSDEMPE